MNIDEDGDRGELSRLQLVQRRLGRTRRLLELYEGSYWCVFIGRISDVPGSRALGAEGPRSLALFHFASSSPSPAASRPSLQRAPLRLRRHLVKRLREHHRRYAIRSG